MLKLTRKVKVNIMFSKVLINSKEGKSNINSCFRKKKEILGFKSHDYVK